MPTVKADLVKQAVAGWNLFEQTVTRVFQVSGLSIYPPASVVAQAMQQSGVPVLGEGHPQFPNLIVVNLTTDTDPSYDVVNVYVQYRWRSYLGSFLKSVSGSLREVTKVIIGTDGKPLVNTYLPPGATHTYQQVILAKQQLLEGIVTFKFLEQLDPEYFNLTWSGYTNSKPWRGYAMRTLKILPIDGSSQDNFWYSNNYSFQYKSDTFDQYSFYTDTWTNQVPQDVLRDVTYDGTRTFGNGWLRLQVDPQVDFNLLFADIPQLPPNTYGLELNSLLGT